MRLNKPFYIIFSSFILLAGCWDVVNIEERGFIIGSAIDLVDHKDSKQELMMTNQVVVPAGMVSPSVESGPGEQAFLNFTSTGISIFEMEEKVATQSSKIPYYEHLSVLIVSENVLQKEKLFPQVLDTYIRDVNLRRGVKIVVAEGKAKSLLEFTSPNYKLPARYVEELLEKGSRQVGFIKPVVAGDIEEFHLKNNSYLLPYVITNDLLEYKKGAVFHGVKKQMVGLFNEKEMQGFGLITGEHTLKVIDFPYKEEAFALDVIRSKSKMRVDPKNINNINVSLDIEIEGVIKELIHQENLTKPEAIKSIQKAVSEHVKQLVEEVINKGQHELGTDVFGVWQQMETKHYKQWKQVKDEWEEGKYYFKNVSFDINVLTEIYSTGTTKKTD